ncbi:MAG: MlaD family protein [Elusimicrobia bacterium]|nr:MlaD family protein [Elusimicrobiota bacterium]MDD7578581.1 MlaD family protein [Elusimicrobiota bacterium]MDY6039457.1 MlaD family protein [Elusimicrobiaceae bacterium]
MKPETKLGIFTVLGLIVFGFSLYFLGGFSVTRSYDLNIKFADVSGLPVKAPVKLSGVEVGKVKQIKIENGDVIVVAQINEAVAIHPGARFSVVMTGIIGSKYLKVEQGDTMLAAYKPGAYIDGVNELPMDAMITQTMASIKEFVDSVNNQGEFGDQLNQTMTEVRQLSANLNQLVASMKPYLTRSAQNLDDLTERLDALLAGIEQGQGVIGGLMKDEQMKQDVKESVTNLKETMSEVKTFVGKMSRFHVYWDYDFFYMPDSKLAVSDLALEIFPSSGYTFYRAGISNLGNEDDRLDSKDYLEKNKFDVRFGLYNKWAAVSAGLIRGAGGVALELKPFYDKEFLERFTFTGEFSDWGRDRVINNRLFNKPNLSYGVDFRFNRFFSVGAWSRDVLETNDFAVKANISFNDQDISSFFGLATMAH